MKETQSESVKMANEILKANKQSKIGQKLEKSLEKVENLETPKFEDVYQPAQPSENRNYNQSGNSPAIKIVMLTRSVPQRINHPLFKVKKLM
ncbi:hypothetical protein [Chryseobacterium gossypii]|uniref:hypothetical protein n=1 Tax=Chryseobacterium gossypii TaxID=3231602 RepID=UPI00352604C2